VSRPRSPLPCALGLGFFLVCPDPSPLKTHFHSLPTLYQPSPTPAPAPASELPPPPSTQAPPVQCTEIGFVLVRPDPVYPFSSKTLLHSLPTLSFTHPHAPAPELSSPPHTGARFEPYLPTVLPLVLEGLADPTEAVRDACLTAAHGVVGTYLQAASEVLLPPLQTGLASENYR
jgi:hypothetical protein